MGGRDDGTHQCELQQLLGGRRGVRAKVQHQRLAVLRRDRREDRGTLDALDHAEHEVRRGHQRAGIAGADAGAGVARGHEVERAAQR
jgi:hypothetical protein